MLRDHSLDTDGNTSSLHCGAQRWASVLLLVGALESGYSKQISHGITGALGFGYGSVTGVLIQSSNPRLYTALSSVQFGITGSVFFCMYRPFRLCALDKSDATSWSDCTAQQDQRLVT